MTVRVPDHNGWYEIARNPLSAVGVFPYSKKAIQYPGGTFGARWQDDPNGTVMVYRPESELSDPAAVNSFRLTPWVDDHAMLGNPEVDPSLTPAEQKGVHGVIGQDLEYDPQTRKLYGNIKLFSKSQADAVDAGKKELSMGFRCKYRYEDGDFEGKPFGAIQTDIRGNHQASVDFGRMGPEVAVLDTFDSAMTFCFDAKDLIPMPAPKKKTTRRAKIAAKLGVAQDALLAHMGMDGADAAALKSFNTALDAEEDDEEGGEGEGGGAGDLSLAEITDTIKEAAGPLGELQAALAEIGGAGAPDAGEDPDDVLDDDTMEPTIDTATGQQKMDAAGKPMFQKKKAAAPAVDANPMMAGCDAAIAAMDGISKRANAALKGRTKPAALATFDAALVATKAARAKVTKKAKPQNRGTGMDANDRAILNSIKDGTFIQGVVKQTAQRDALAKQLSGHIGVFDASEMTLGAVATYGAGKLGLTNIPVGQEVTAVNAYLQNRQPAASRKGDFYGMDSAPTPGANKSVADFIAGV